MRIGVNCYPLVANSGGVKQYFFNLFKELLTNNNEKHSYLFFYFSHNIEELSGLDSLRWQDNAILLKNQFEVKQYLDKIDLYFCPVSALWPRPLPVPTVLFLHDIQEVFYPEFFTRSDMFSRDYHYPGSTRMADRVITNSDFTKQTIVQHHRISPKKVSVAHLCADKRFFRAAEVACSPHFSLPNENFIVYPANRWKHKNHDTLLRALQWLKVKKGLKIKAIFTGYDVLNCYPLVQKASEYGLEEQIYSAGYLTVEELAYLYLKARIMVFPSLFEGFGIPLVEAMAVGCPVIASNVTSLPEIGADAVEYFDPLSPESIGMAIEKIWHDTAMRERMIKLGKRRAHDFSATKLAQTHLTVFQEAAESFSTARYLWHNWIYKYYHRGLIYLKYRKGMLM